MDGPEGVGTQWPTPVPRRGDPLQMSASPCHGHARVCTTWMEQSFMDSFFAMVDVSIRAAKCYRNRHWALSMVSFLGEEKHAIWWSINHIGPLSPWRRWQNLSFWRLKHILGMALGSPTCAIRIPIQELTVFLRPSHSRSLEFACWNPNAQCASTWRERLYGDN